MSQYQFCRFCGSSLAQGRPYHPQRCAQCGNTQFHSPQPVAVAIVPARNKTGQKGYVSVIRNIAPAIGGLCFPGGYVDNCEATVQAALREFEEEVGLDLTVLPDFAGLQFVAERGTQCNQMLFFYKVKGVELQIESLTNFDPHEVQGVVLAIPGQTELCFPTHQSVLDLLVPWGLV